MIKNINKNETIKRISVLKGTTEQTVLVVITTERFSTISFETVLQKDWVSYKGKQVDDVLSIYGDDIDEFIRALDIIYSSDVNTIPYNPDFIDVTNATDIVMYAFCAGSSVDQIADSSVVPRLKEHGYSIVMPEIGGKKYRCIKKDGDNRMLMF